MNLTCGTNLNEDAANAAMKNNTFQMGDSPYSKPGYNNYKG